MQKVKNIYWSSGCGLFCLIFRDRDQVCEIAHQGQCEDDARAALPYFHAGQQFDAYSDEKIRDLLAEYGIEREGVDGIDNMTRQDLEMYLVWIAANDIRDQPDNY